MLMTHDTHRMPIDDTNLDGRRVLIVADDWEGADAIRDGLRRDRLEVLIDAYDDGLAKRITTVRPSVILLKLGHSWNADVSRLKSMVRICERERLPLLVIGPSEEVNELVALSLGADDYLSTRVSVDVLAARLKAILRRTSQVPRIDQSIRIGPVTIDEYRHTIKVNQRDVELTPTEFRILHTVIAARGEVVTRVRLTEAAFGSGTHPLDRRIDVHLTGLRRKLGDAAQWLHTVRGTGYAWRTDSSATSN